MPTSQPPSNILHLLCGKIASGKSTLSDQLAAAPGTVLLREDVWLSSLFGAELRTLKDYVAYSARLRQAMAPHIIALLNNGTSVVLDFPANTRENRLWMRELIEQAQCRHQLHFLDIPDEVCKARLRRRNASGRHEFSVTDDQFDRISSHFQPPSEDEGFVVKVYRADA